MGRRRKRNKQTITILVKGTAIRVILHPPAPPRTSWYAYWPGLTTSRSTGTRNYEDAVVLAEEMLRNGGKKRSSQPVELTDEEFEAIQRWHFSRKTDESAMRRSKKSLVNCLDSVAAFREITGLSPISLATPDDCATFQRLAMILPNNWRRRPVEKRQSVAYFSEKCRLERLKAGRPDQHDNLPTYSPNSVLRWSRSLQAAFERANRNAMKRKCVRGVVAVEKLLTVNPWSQFIWIEGRRRPIRQFDGDELISILDFLKAGWLEVTVATAVVKTLLWSWNRRMEVMGLTWNSLRTVGDEYHFHIVGKKGIEKWFRIPPSLYRELEQFRTNSQFVFAAYKDQLRHFHKNRKKLNAANFISGTFSPEQLGDWFYRRIVEWSKSLPRGHASTHVFRKTTLQLARRGEDVNRIVASDARLSEGVMMTNYVTESDEEFRQRSNRTYHRIVAALSLEVADRYGYSPTSQDRLEEQIRAAAAVKDWNKVMELSQQLQAVQEMA